VRRDVTTSNKIYFFEDVGFGIPRKENYAMVLGVVDYI